LTLQLGQLVADRITVPMKYCQTVSLPNVVIGSYVFSQNSPYDPNVTSSGGSVAGWSAYTALYNRCRVTASRIRVSAQNGDGGGTSFIALAAAQTNVGTGESAEKVAMYRYAKPKVLKVLSNNGYGPEVVLEDSIKIAELLGDELYDEVSLYCLGNTDPTQQFYWVIGGSDPDTASLNVFCGVEIEYMVEWSRPVTSPA